MPGKLTWCSWHVALLLLVALLTSTGCRPAGPQRYQVRGEVAYDGQPVAAGRVIFEPSTADGQRGPAGYADIVQGEYVTLPGKGVVGGPHEIRVICLTGVAEGAELQEGRMICPEFRDTIDLPLEDTVHNIDVPGTLTWQR